MKKILLATTLLSIAMSENILMENYLKPKTIWLHDKQFWNRKIKQMMRSDTTSELDNLVNYDRQLPRVSDTRFISETKKVPAIAIVRRSNKAQYSQTDNSDKPKVENAKPMILISIGIQEDKKASENLQNDCSANYHRKHNQDWQLQEPFYVEEPKWVEIDPDYYTDSSRRLNSDPYILTRGKKIFRIKDPEQGDKTVENYEFFDYSSKSKMSPVKNRGRRSVEINKKYQDSTEKEINHHNSLQDTNTDMIKTDGDKFSKIGKKSEDRRANEEEEHVSVPLIKNKLKDKLKNLTKKSSHKFATKNQISANGVIITNFMGQEPKTQHEDDPDNIANHNSTADEGEKFNDKSHFANDTNKRNKRSTLLKNIKSSESPKRHKTYEIEWVDVNSKKSAEKNGTAVFEENKAYIDKSNDLNTYGDFFILSRGKNSLDREGKNGSNKNDAEELWEHKYSYAHRKKMENKEEEKNAINKSEADNDDTGTTDSQSADKFVSKTFEIKNYLNNRKKRNTCESCKMSARLQEELWWKNIEKNIQSLERRDKHSDILEGLKLTEPYIISRGKKALHEFKDNFFRMLKLRNKDDENHAKIRTFLDMILMEKYNDENYDASVAELSKQTSPRDRRGEFEEIVAPYDPYYMARGKRVDLHNFLTKTRLLQNEKFETDAKQ